MSEGLSSCHHDVQEENHIIDHPWEHNFRELDRKENGSFSKALRNALVRASGLQVPRLLACGKGQIKIQFGRVCRQDLTLVADALGAWFGWAITGQVTLFATVLVGMLAIVGGLAERKHT